MFEDRRKFLTCLSVKLTHQFSETFTNTLLTNKLPSYLIYHNGTQDLGSKFVLSKSIKKVFFSYYNCNLIRGIYEIYQQLPYYATVYF